MSLYDGILDQNDTPAAVPVQKTVELPPCLITIKTASNGEKIMMCSVTPPPASAIETAKQAGLALFTTAEIVAMRQAGEADERFISRLIESRKMFGWGGPIRFEAA